MSRFDYRTLPVSERTQLVGELVDMLVATKNKGDLTKFVLQLLTPSEVVMLARRWQIAQHLAQGKSYYAIAHDLKVGMTTIQSVDRWLSAAIGDYRTRIEEARRQALKKKKYPRSRISPLPNTLPFLLLNLVIQGMSHVWWKDLENRKSSRRDK